MKRIRPKTIAIILFLFAFSWQIAGQTNILFEKENFPPEQKNALKEAIKEIKSGDKYFYDDIPVYSLAIEYYLIANDFNPNNALLNYKIGKCYLKTIQKTKSIPYLEKALLLDPNIRPDIVYLLAQGYHLNLNLDEAIGRYNEYKGSLSPHELSQLGDEIDKKISECKVAKEMIRNPVRLFIDNLGPQVNTKFPEYGPYINADETVLMFTSSRDNTTGGKTDPLDLMYFEDIYISRKIDETWTKTTNPGSPLNSYSHDAIVGVSPDGKHALIYKGEDKGGDIFECRIKEDGSWKLPKRLPKEINTDFHESSASFSPDMKGLYFVSDKPGGFGGKDIYFSELSIKGNKDKLDYEDAVNLGGVINTPYDEQGVFMNVDGKTLYFSSKGHNTMGGYDIFKSVFEDGKWSLPENLGYPINTPDDDIFFSFSRDGRHAYYSSFDPDGYGHRDIYMITILGPEKPVVFQNDYDYLAFLIEPVDEVVLEGKVEIKETQIAIVKGRIMDAVTLSPLGGVIVEIYDNELGRLVASFESNTRTGEYMISLPSGENYGFGIKAKEYMFHSENLIIPPSTIVQEIYMDIMLNKVEVGSKIILKNIFFDFDKATLRPESAAELNRLTKMLNDIPTMKIEISGHTDNIGSDLYNQQLSEARAKAVVEYLTDKGIFVGRMTYVGYGEAQPIALNDSEDGRQMNRRTEFTVISK
ncbi:MAG: OmpA family protein [Bacteroidales bacterium]|nr:OmpA family protein [Bacteroidales bacterium]